MNVKQIYTNCLAQGAYYIQSENEVAIIDPLREVQPYLDLANHDDAEVKYIFETHFHADFVSGHLTLANKTGAPIIYGPDAAPGFDALIAEDGQIFSLGKLKIKVIHTPGHTLESTTYLLIDEKGNDHAIFTGDSLFLGDVGRPDLAQKADEITMEDLAGMSYDSLRNKIMTLSDEVIIYPGHGAGSACGKNMMKITSDTLGNQKLVNYALREDMTKEEFVKEVTNGLESPPAYFPLNVKLNKSGYKDIDQILASSLKALNPQEFLNTLTEHDALVLDVRSPQAYAKAHVPGSMFIGLNGSFAPWVGELVVDIDKPLLLVIDEGREREAITRLSRVGFDHVLGYLQGGLEAWQKNELAVQRVETISAEALPSFMADGVGVYDVRRDGEYDQGHVDGAVHVPLSNLEVDKFPKNKKFAIHCAGGYRSMIAASILLRQGISAPVNVNGGYGKIKNTGVKIEQSQYVS